jgi:hypothetical protein
VRRFALVAIALSVLWVLLLGAAAGIPLSAPLFAQRQAVLNGQDFRPVMGAGVEDGSALGIGAIASDGNAMQSIPLERIRAVEHRLLTYRFEDFPRSLELLLVFRRADTPDDVQTVALPWAGDGVVTVDLAAATPAWSGEITELGFAEYATAQLVPPSIAFQPFRLVSAQLASPSWNAMPRLLRAAWFGYRPWSLASINVVGSSSDRNASMPATIAIGMLLSVLIAAWLLRWSRAQVLRGAVFAAALAWALLDLRWLDDLSAKQRLTASIYAGKSWAEQARLQPDEDVAGFAQLVRQHLADPALQRRVLVASDSTYTLLRLIYLLLPLNAAPLESAVNALPASEWPADAVIVLCASKRWRFDEATSMLVSEGRTVPAMPLFAGGNLSIYRLRGDSR